MPEEETRTPIEMASYIINATDPSTLALRAAALVGLPFCDRV